MLKRLRELFASQPGATGASGSSADGKLPLAEVLANGWAELWYQPKIDLKTMRLVGSEGLVRARHPVRGVLPPALFLPGAPESDMLALTEHIIIRALRDWEDCNAAGASVKLAVNVPVSALTTLPLGQIMREERPKAENWPGLIMEVTEDEIIHNLRIANAVADDLKAHGCSLAVDDFGAGYSSLLRLRQLPFSELKIDRSYITNCHSDKVNAGLCETIVELGKRFNLKTVAEGVETTHEAHKLQAIGCDVGQGYLFAKPMPKEHFISILRKRLMGKSTAA